MNTKEQKKKRILEYLKSRKKPVPARALAAYAETDYWNEGSSPYCRKLIRELISDGHAIGSNNKGYFMLRNDRDTQRYLNGLLKRQAAISQRIADVFYGRMGGK